MTSARVLVSCVGATLRVALAVAAATLAGCGGGSPRGGAGTPTPTPTPSPDQAQVVEAIFSRYAEAVGGQEAVDRVESYVLKGRFEVTGSDLKLPVEVYFKKPDKSLMVIEVPRVGVIRRGRGGGGQAWVQTPFSTGARATGTAPMNSRRSSGITTFTRRAGSGSCISR